MHFKINTLFQFFFLQISLKYITLLFVIFLVSKFFIFTCFLLVILIKETKAWNIRSHGKFWIFIFSKWIGVFSVYPKFCIDEDDSYSQASKYFDKTSGRKGTSFSFLIEIFKFISLVYKICNACMAKPIVTSPFVIFRVWWLKMSISYM